MESPPHKYFKWLALPVSAIRMADPRPEMPNSFQLWNLFGRYLFKVRARLRATKPRNLDNVLLYWLLVF